MLSIRLAKSSKKEIVPFEKVLPADLSALSSDTLNALKKEYNDEYTKSLNKIEYMGKKNATVAHLIMKEVLSRWGLA